MLSTRSYPVTTLTSPIRDSENGNCNDFQFNPPSFEKLETRHRKLRTRVLLSLFGVLALILVIVPTVIMVVLQENKGIKMKERERARARARRMVPVWSLFGLENLNKENMHLAKVIDSSASKA